MKKQFLLILAILIGSALRLWSLHKIPNGLTWDEAAIGYNAYSILKTGRDEHGTFLPIIFKSFGDYKPGAYIYLTVPFVGLFGLSELSVRLASALAGILAIWGVYLFTREILSERFQSKDLLIASQLSAFALAVSPWHVHFSRGAWEVNVCATLILFSIYFLLRFIRNQSSPYPVLILTCLSLAMYQAAKLLIPLLFVFIITVCWKGFIERSIHYLKFKRPLLVLPLLGFISWVYVGSFFGSAGNRLSTLSIFNYRPEISQATKQIDDQDQTSIELYHNQTELSLRLVASRYLYHFSPEVLFYEGSVITERGHIPGLGVLNPLEFIWIGFGFIYLIRHTSHKVSTLIIGLLLLSPIPASLTLAEFSTVRALFMAIPLSLISGLGLYYAYTKLRSLFFIFLPVYLIGVIYVFDLYFVHSSTVFAKEFNYGYKQAVQIIKDNPTSKVVFTDVNGQPYIYYLFYTGYSPRLYQQSNHFIDGGLDVGRVDRVDNVEFHQFSGGDIDRQKDTLFIGSEGNINNKYDIAGDNIALFNQIETPDHKIIFRVIKTRP